MSRSRRMRMFFAVAAVLGVLAAGAAGALVPASALEEGEEQIPTLPPPPQQTDAQMQMAPLLAAGAVLRGAVLLAPVVTREATNLTRLGGVGPAVADAVLPVASQAWGAVTEPLMAAVGLTSLAYDYVNLVTSLTGYPGFGFPSGYEAMTSFLVANTDFAAALASSYLYGQFYYGNYLVEGGLQQAVQQYQDSDFCEPTFGCYWYV
jgi:hypothetical protein